MIFFHMSDPEHTHKQLCTCVHTYKHTCTRVRIRARLRKMSRRELIISQDQAWALAESWDEWRCAKGWERKRLSFARDLLVDRIRCNHQSNKPCLRKIWSNGHECAQCPLPDHGLACLQAAEAGRSSQLHVFAATSLPFWLTQKFISDTGCCWVWNEAQTLIACQEKQVSCPYTSTVSDVLLASGTAFWQATMTCWARSMKLIQGWLTKKEVRHLKSYLLFTKYQGLMCTPLLSWAVPKLTWVTLNCCCVSTWSKNGKIWIRFTHMMHMFPAESWGHITPILECP